MSPKDREAVASITREALSAVDGNGKFSVTADGCIFVNYKHDEHRYCRVVRSHGRYVTAFLFHEANAYQSFVHHSKIGLVMPGAAFPFRLYADLEAAYSVYLQKNQAPRGKGLIGYDTFVERMFAEHGGRSFTGRGWQKEMGEVLAAVALTWIPPWRTT